MIGHQQGWKENIEKNLVLGKMKMKRPCKVVAVTAFVNETLEKRATTIGIKRVLPKPVCVEMIKEVVLRYFFDKE